MANVIQDGPYVLDGASFTSLVDVQGIMCTTSGKMGCLYLKGDPKSTSTSRSKMVGFATKLSQAHQHNDQNYM
eukprot:12444061-Ditylum_brightwellii.AAC.1